MSRISFFFLVAFISLARDVVAERFLLSDPMPAAGPALNGVAIGGAPHGFLLAGTASHRPVAVPLDGDGKPRLVGVAELGLTTASAVGEPVFVDGRWVVPISPDFLNPDRLFISEMRDDGTLVRAPHSYPFPRMAFAEVVAGTDGLLVVATRSEGVNRYSLSVRTLSRDLETLGSETTLPGTLVFPGAVVRSFRGIQSGDGFLIAYATDSALLVARVSREGALLGDPVVVRAATTIVSPDVATIGADAIVVWTQGIAPASWSLHSTRLSAQAGPINDIATVEGIHAPAVFLRRTRGDLINLVWQGIDNRDGRRVGSSSIQRQWLDVEARPVRALAGFQAQDEVLVGVASSGDLLLAWEKHVVGLGVSLEGNVPGRNEPVIGGIKPNTPLRLSFREPRSLAIASADGIITVSRIEKSSADEFIVTTRHDREGRRLEYGLTVQGRFGSIDVATGGGMTTYVWQEGTTIKGLIRDHLVPRAISDFVLDVGNQVSEPRVTWDGSRFVVMWRDTDTLSAAFVSIGAVHKLGVLVKLPSSQSSAFSFRPFSLHIAANATGIVAVASVVEIDQCGFPFCSEKNYLAIARINGTGEVVTTELQPADSDPMPDVATDGREFLIISKTARDLRTEVVGIHQDGAPDQRRLFEWVLPFGPRIAWGGSDYVAAWSYAVGGTAEIVATRLDRTGTNQTPLRKIRSAGGLLQVAAFHGDALIAWVGGISDPNRSEVVFGQFLSDAEGFGSRRRTIRSP